MAKETKQRKFDSNIKALAVMRGYNSIMDFSVKENISYHQLRKVMHGTAITIDVQFLITVCEKLDCQIGDLIILNKEGNK